MAAADPVLSDDGWADGIASLHTLESFTVPLTPGQREERERACRESGTLTRETIARLLAGEFW